jgi:hypothetical protein
MFFCPTDYRAIKTEHGAKLWRDGGVMAGVMAAFYHSLAGGDLFSEPA